MPEREKRQYTVACASVCVSASLSRALFLSFSLSKNISIYRDLMPLPGSLSLSFSLSLLRLSEVHDYASDRVDHVEDMIKVCVCVYVPVYMCVSLSLFLSYVSVKFDYASDQFHHVETVCVCVSLSFSLCTCVCVCVSRLSEVRDHPSDRVDDVENGVKICTRNRGKKKKLKSEIS